MIMIVILDSGSVHGSVVKKLASSFTRLARQEEAKTETKVSAAVEIVAVAVAAGVDGNGKKPSLLLNEFDPELIVIDILRHERGKNGQEIQSETQTTRAQFFAIYFITCFTRCLRY